jgi:nucleoside-diphosphate-sugar epimerase/glycosyltransferase involved in cell wall biosynthesis
VVTSPEVIVIGGNGFIGSAVLNALRERGFRARVIPAPRIQHVSEEAALRFVESSDKLRMALAASFEGAYAVVNAAGLAEASSADEEGLMAANGALAGILASATARARVRRFVHVSSAAVQGRKEILDASQSFSPLTAYSRSKVLGEVLAQRFGPESTVIYRPASVHGQGRHVTEMTAKIARSFLSTVAYPGSANTPQALVQNIGDAIAFLASTVLNPPSVVSHPSEGLSTGQLLYLLGSRNPVRLPRTPAKVLLRALAPLGRRQSAIGANLRRIEVLWFGQQQSQSWLTESGWKPPRSNAEWHQLGRRLNERQEDPRKHPARLKRIFIVATVPEQIRVQYDAHLELFRRSGVAVDIFVGGSPKPDARVHPIPLNRNLSPLAVLRAVRIIRAQARILSPDMVIYGSPIAALAGALSSFRKIPRRVFVVHGLREETLLGLRRTLAVAGSYMTARLSTDIVFLSPSTCRRASFLAGIGHGKITVAPGGFVGVNPQLVAFQTHNARDKSRIVLGYLDSHVVLGFMGRLAKDKGITELVEAFQLANALNQDLRLLLVGAIDEEDRLTKRTLNTIRDDAHITHVSHMQDPIPMYAAMDFFCLPSYREGLPTVVIEAAMANLPLILTTVTGTIDVVNRDEARFCPPRSTARLSAAISHATSNPDESILQASRARVTVVERYASAVVNEWWSRFYNVEVEE